MHYPDQALQGAPGAHDEARARRPGQSHADRAGRSHRAASQRRVIDAPVAGAAVPRRDWDHRAGAAVALGSVDDADGLHTVRRPPGCRGIRRGKKLNSAGDDLGELQLTIRRRAQIDPLPPGRL